MFTKKPIKYLDDESCIKAVREAITDLFDTEFSSQTTDSLEETKRPYTYSANDGKKISILDFYEPSDSEFVNLNRLERRHGDNFNSSNYVWIAINEGKEQVTALVSNTGEIVHIESSCGRHVTHTRENVYEKGSLEHDLCRVFNTNGSLTNAFNESLFEAESEYSNRLDLHAGGFNSHAANIDIENLLGSHLDPAFETLKQAYISNLTIETLPIIMSSILDNSPSTKINRTLRKLGAEVKFAPLDTDLSNPNMSSGIVVNLSANGTSITTLLDETGCIAFGYQELDEHNKVICDFNYELEAGMAEEMRASLSAFEELETLGAKGISNAKDEAIDKLRKIDEIHGENDYKDIYKNADHEEIKRTNDEIDLA